VKNTGDGFLAEFQSVVAAVRCAVEVQQGMAYREPEMPEERRIKFRIGVNLGDVIAEEHDIFGDGVNVAARLEALSEPGGICVSRVVRDQVRDRLDFAFEDMGEQQVKNIARPVRVYALRIQGVPGVPTADASPTTSTSPPFAAPRLSIVVLPFTNLSDDREQQYFADGIAEDLTTDLSRLANMFVISRNTAFTYRNQPIDTKQIGRELAVRYVLEGSVRRAGGQVRVSAQLIDAETDTHLWAERFDGEATDLFALQDEITSRIAVALNIELVAAEAARPTANSDALDYILRGRAELEKPRSPDTYARAIGFFEHALALDPSSVEAQSRLAFALTARVLDEMADTGALDSARAEALVRRALAASPRSLIAHIAKGMVLRAQHRNQEAIREYETAISFDHNWASGYAQLASCKFNIGSIDETIPLVEKAIRLSPRDGRIGNWSARIGIVHLVQSRMDEAILWLEKARSANPAHPVFCGWLAAAYALNNETERASAELAEARRLSSDDRYLSIARLRAADYWGRPKTRALLEATFFGGLRRAGMPEE